MSTTVENPRIGIIIGTTREGRFGGKAGRWLHEIAEQRCDLDVEIVDLRDYPLGLFNEEISPAYARPTGDVARRWSQKLAELDGYIFITAEYNRSISGSLKNALDYTYTEFNKKPAAFVGYGSVGGARAIEHLRLICIEMQMAPMRSGIHIGVEPYLAAHRDKKPLHDFEHLNKGAMSTLDELAWWSVALKSARRQDAHSGRDADK